MTTTKAQTTGTVILVCSRCRANKVAGDVRTFAYGTDGTRINAAGETVTLRNDRSCPNCRLYLDPVEVKAVVTNHSCDEKCKTAEGSLCRCSCGGKHHGEAYRV